MESCRTEKTEEGRFRAENESHVSKIIDAQVEPLFSLPADLMTRKRKEQEPRAMGKMQNSRESTYTAKRLREENFRR